MKTNCGSFTIRLDQKQSPNAAASFVALVQRGFFDDTIFHRIVPGFVIQGGDPTGDRHRRPRLLDRRQAAGGRATYTHGVVAMAKTGSRARRARPAASSSSSPAPTPACRPTTRSSARSRRGSTSSTGSASSATPNEQPTQVVEIEQATVSVAP